MSLLENKRYEILLGDCKERLKEFPDNFVDSIVTDPPYELGFMNKSWDATGIAYDVELWKECFRVLKPGGHLLSFGGSRTYHRMACAIEDAGFEIRDQIMWVYGSGFPKSHNVALGIDKSLGHPDRGRAIPAASTHFPNGKYAEGKEKLTSNKVDVYKSKSDEAKEWEGWGTALKPAHEPIVVARKPFKGTVSKNVLEWGVGGINVDGCRVGNEEISTHNAPKGTFAGGEPDRGSDTSSYKTHLGRWPANIIHDGSEEVIELLPNNSNRFFYCSKTSKKDRNEGCEDLEEKWLSGYCYYEQGNLGNGMFKDRNTLKKNNHPTVKPTDLMCYLERLVTPKDKIVLDPFMGSGSTGKAAMYEGFKFIGIEMNEEYVEIAKRRIEFAMKNSENKIEEKEGENEEDTV